MRNSNCRWLPAKAVVICLCAAMTMAQETTIRPTPREVASLLVMTKTDFDARLSAWKTYDIMHVDRDKVKAELSTSRPSEPVHIVQCGKSADVQWQTARDFAPLGDVYSYWAFIYTSNDKPAENELLWCNLDNPFINHVRRMRQIVAATPIVAHLYANVAGRPATLEEVQWQFIASLGCGYRGVLWPVSYEDVTWGDDLKQIEQRIGRYGRFLAQSRPVGWAKAPEGQGVSALACEGYLFVFLLNGAYMNLDADGKSVPAPLERPLCEGSITLALPQGLKVRQGQTLLSAKPLRLKTEEGKTTAPYGFKTGGEMLIFTLGGKVEPAAASRPTTRPETRPAATPPATAEKTQ